MLYKSTKKQNFYLKQKNLTGKIPLLKMKTKGIKRSSGRNNSGKITVAHKGGGHKRSYRFINFFRYASAVSVVCSVEYDPNRSAFIAAVYDFTCKKFYYILAPMHLKIGDMVESGPNAPLKQGNSLPTKRIPKGSYVYNLAVQAKGCAKIARSAGTFAILKEKKATGSVFELSSGKSIHLPLDCFGSLGVVSNGASKLKKKHKAGQSRWLNKRPTVRGVAMNPIDHPHGGGEGKKSGLNKSPWGKYNQRGSTGNPASKKPLTLKNE